MAQLKFLLLCLWMTCLKFLEAAEDQTCSATDGSCASANGEQQNACEDQDETCEYWAGMGECVKNPGYMRIHCKNACGLCPGGKLPPEQKSGCRDDHEKCEEWAETSECDANPGYMLVSCQLSCGVCVDPNLTVDSGIEQELSSSKFPDITSEAVEEQISKSEEYMRSTFLRKSLREACKNTDPLCTIWSLAGRCESDPNFMLTKCAPACQSCIQLSIEGRCPRDPNAPDAWESGDLNKMFEKLTSEPYLTKYSVETLSSPATGGPWIITMEDVVSEEEAKRLIALGHKQGYLRSSDVGKMKADGTTEKNINEGRTSENAWCLGPCYKDDLTQAVVQRLSNITEIPETNSEYLQLLRYEESQFYNNHHDYIAYLLNRQQGVRIMTMYLYLNEPEAGGGTHFDKYDITVMPKRGRALLWPSVLNDKPNMKDDRTTHEALPVEKGIKYGANAWFHMNDFKTPFGSDCA